MSRCLVGLQDVSYCAKHQKRADELQGLDHDSHNVLWSTECEINRTFVGLMSLLEEVVKINNCGWYNHDRVEEFSSFKSSEIKFY